MTLGLLRRSFSVVPLAAALLVFSFSGKADTLTGTLFFHAPQGNFPTGPYLAADGSGSFSFDSSLLNGLTETTSVDVLASNLTSFNLTITAFGVLDLAHTITGPTATYVYGLSDLTSFDLVVHRFGNTVFSPGMNGLTTLAVAGNISDYGTGTFSSETTGGPVGAHFAVSVFPASGFPRGNSTTGGLGEAFTAVVTTPEPASFLLAAPALAALWFMRRKKAA